MEVIIAVLFLVAFLGFCAWKVATDEDTPAPVAGAVGGGGPEGRNPHERTK